MDIACLMPYRHPVMPVNSTHADYGENVDAWLRIRDVLAGDRAIKRAGEKYVARLDSQTDVGTKLVVGLRVQPRDVFLTGALDGAITSEHVADAHPGIEVFVVVRMRRIHWHK